MFDLLEGVRVLECARLLNGDTLGMYLGQLGADVVKIEQPGRGDYLRDIMGSVTPGNSPAHLQFNSNKRSVALDLRSPEGRDVFWDLLETADVFLDGNIGGTCERLGIGYDEQRRRHQRIIYCQYTGFGVTGPYATIPAHGISMNAVAGDTPRAMGADGVMHPVVRDELIPRKGPEATAAGALWAAYFVTAALLRQRTSGAEVGQYIDVAGSDAVVATTGIANVYGLNQHRLTSYHALPHLTNGDELLGARYQYYETSDSKVVIFGCIEPKFFNKFCTAVGRTDLIEDDERVDSVRYDDDLELRHELQRIFHTRTQAEWLSLAASADIAIAPCANSVTELLDDVHVAQRNILDEGVHPVAGPFTYLGVPAVIDGQKYEVQRPAPSLGQHTVEILRELGRDEKQIDLLRSAGVIDYPIRSGE